MPIDVNLCWRKYLNLRLQKWRFLCSGWVHSRKYNACCSFEPLFYHQHLRTKTSSLLRAYLIWVNACNLNVLAFNFHFSFLLSASQRIQGEWSLFASCFAEWLLTNTLLLLLTAIPQKNKMISTAFFSFTFSCADAGDLLSLPSYRKCIITTVK